MSMELRTHIYGETDLSRLTRWVKLAARAGSMEEFTEKMSEADAE